MNANLLVTTEERLNARRALGRAACQRAASLWKVDRRILGRIDSRLALPSAPPPTTVFEEVMAYIPRLGPRFIKKNGTVNASAFYTYAYVDKSTWSELRHSQVTPSKKTLQKLAIALRLGEAEAAALLAKGHCAFEPDDLQDQVILALLDLQQEDPSLDVDAAMEVLEYYRTHGAQPFDSIYDTPDILLERKKAGGR